MEIILLERVEKLGKLGDVVTVKSGYARNFLLPTGKALRASKANLEKFETERLEREQKNADSRTEAEQKSNQMDGLSVNLVRAASEMGQLFGSVTARDIAAAVTEAGQPVDKRQVVMDNAIKTLGLFPIKISLHAEVAISVTVNIARSLEEAETQRELGRAVIASDQDGEVDDNPTGANIIDDGELQDGEKAKEEMSGEEAPIDQNSEDGTEDSLEETA